MPADQLEAAGDTAATVGNTSLAISRYQQAMDAAPTPSRNLFDKLGQQFMTAGRPFETMAVLDRAIAQYGADADLRRKMVSVQASLGLQRDAAVHLRWLIQRGHGTLGLLIMASDLSRPQTVESTCRYSLKQFPQDLRPQFSLACMPAYRGEWQAAAELLAPVVAAHPEFVPAQALYGRVLVELEDHDAIEQWASGTPPPIQQSPQYWIAAAIHYQRNNDLEKASQAYALAAKRAPDDGEILTRWAAVLAQQGSDEESRHVAKRASQVASLRTDVDSLLGWNHQSQTAAVQVAQRLEQMGRLWESTTWLQAALPIQQNPRAEIQSLYKTVRAKLTRDTPWRADDSVVAELVATASSFTPDWSLGDVPTSRTATDSLRPPARFADQAVQRGLDHVCRLHPSTKPQTGLMIYQSNAGGVGAADFDNDGWPDIYLTQSDGDPFSDTSSPNRMFRNLDGEFADVTEHSGGGDRGFSQGVCLADYNDDGFVDILANSIGTSHLYRNNGDGTFSQVKSPAGFPSDLWTTSSAIADFDSDGNADIFLVGYCAGQAPFEQPCFDANLGENRSCSPLVFEAQHDRVFRGVGDGTFVDATDQWLQPHTPGRGFGIVVGQIDSTPGLDAYVANDMSSNHFWTRDRSEEQTFGWSEQASLRGLALNARSLSQASMGIATGDADNDGDLDFLLTHFSDDHNTFYEQVVDGVWSDRSKQVDLASPSVPMLGFGTQFLDTDNDGSLELFVANGDIDDFTHEDRLYRQPAQVFNRRDDNHWQQVPGDSIGEYFSTNHLGRAAATLDANRDGLTDLIVTHLFEPVALLINQTQSSDPPPSSAQIQTPSKQIRLWLRSTTGHRDAIGAIAQIKSDQSTQTGWLISGNGFQCSNESCIRFGTGSIEQSHVQLSIQWPSGVKESFGTVDSAGSFLIVEGTGSAFPLDENEPIAGSR
ncbi:ASPIC and UnbV [Rubripirellula lacrimiformis]|uniref:ASPIC and UnbV n=2 Tax=Rubripirellula lacrimiformis TaxID=1930273 RepID=A0A517NFS2_9BACT|nr:ASPIC and UnbV [Rubripirellula lacrimiformis]